MAISNAWEEYKKNLGSSRPWDIINPATQWVSLDVLEERLDICRTCPELVQLTTRCKKCGCFMKVKAQMSHASCPLSKWSSQ